MANWILTAVVAPLVTGVVVSAAVSAAMLFVEARTRKNRCRQWGHSWVEYNRKVLELALPSEEDHLYHFWRIGITEICRGCGEPRENTDVKASRKDGSDTPLSPTVRALLRPQEERGDNG